MTPPDPYRRIACFVDETDPDLARAVIDAGILLRHDGDVTVSVIHVAPEHSVLNGGFTRWEIDREDPERPVREWLAELTEGLDVEPVVLSHRDPAAAAADWAVETGADLLVAASAKNRIQRGFLGSFVTGLTKRAHAPMLVIPPGVRLVGTEEGHPLQPPRNVACCIDESPASATAVAEARRILAGEEGSQLTVLHAVIPPRPIRLRAVTKLLPAPRRKVAREREWLRDQADELPDARGVLVVGHPRDVTSWAEEHDVELLVAGSRSGHGGSGAPGSFAKQLCLHAAMPVLLVPPHAEAGAP
jgi:nucleotide-binding universal stress UspA family protein